ncbi:MAG: hypothetical protein HOB42_12070 [Candidatus Marinimicrobia bacterium]|nr:hypothetical protein [Candidatus Neomarinimicrobiota bacterium]MBT6638691.1 hypothetical protein [Candidatus Neomarinimicrobiota bacterium]
MGLVIVTGISYGQHDWVDSKSIDQHDIKIKYNPKTGFPERVKGLIGNFNRYGMISEINIKGLSNTFIKENKGIFKINPSTLKLERAENRKGKWHISFVQIVDDILVFGSKFGFTVSNNGNVQLVGIKYFPDVKMSTVPSLAKENVLEIAVNRFLKLEQTDTLVGEPDIELIILPIENDKNFTYFLAYHIRLMSGHWAESIFIDANNGSIIKQYPEVSEFYNVTGRLQQYYWPRDYYEPKVLAPVGLKSRTLITTFLGEFPNFEIWMDLTDENGYYSIYIEDFPPYDLNLLLGNGNMEITGAGNNLMRNVTLNGYNYNYTWEMDNSPNTTSKNIGMNVWWHLSKVMDFFSEPPFNIMVGPVAVGINGGSSVTGQAIGTT